MITEAKAADLPRLAEMMAASELLARYRVTRESALRSLSDALQCGDLVLSADSAGLAWVTFAPRMLNGAAYLRLLLVTAEARGGGIGSDLLDTVETRARQRANHLYLLATTDNFRARHFYEMRGYRHVGDLPGLVWPDLDEALYYKTLRPTNQAS